MNTMRIFIVLMILLSLTHLPTASAAKTPEHDLFEWQNLPSLPNPVAGAFVGVSGDALIVAGGTCPMPGRKDITRTVYLDTVFVLQDKDGSWLTEFKLPHPIAFGASVSTDDGLIILGGTDGKACYSTVYRLGWRKDTTRLEIDTLPDLPNAFAYGNAALLNNTIYVAGGLVSPDAKAASKNFCALDLSQPLDLLEWQILEACPEALGRILPTVAAQNSGEKSSLFVVGGAELKTDSNGEIVRSNLSDAWRYDPFEKDQSKRWNKILDFPSPIASAPAVSLGQSHIIVFGSVNPDGPMNYGACGGILAYHTITNTWVPVAGLPENTRAASAAKWQGKIAIIGNAGSSAGYKSSVLSADPSYKKTSFGLANYITFGCYLAILVLVGFYFSKREKTTNDYFLGGKRVHWWAAGMSIYATGFSAISFMSAPAKSYAVNWLYYLGVISLIPVILFTIYFFLPFVRNLNVTTAYEYLEKRFNVSVRLFGSAVFILFQFGRMAIVLLLPAIALATVTGLSVQTCILTMGLLCIIYTVLGGIEAVIWNDCLQVIVLLGGSLLLIGMIWFNTEGGLAAVLSVARADAKFTLVDLSWDWTMPALWVVLIGNMLSNLPPYITDQAVVQRYLTTPDIKQARRALWFNAWFMAPNGLLFFMMGTSLYVFYKMRPELLNPTIPTDAIIPWFVVQNLPAGICGLVIAGIFASSMSSLDSSMHAVATTIVTDFYRRFKPGDSETFYLRLARILTTIIGLFGTTTALIMAASNIISLWEAYMKLLGLISGGIAGIFLLGILTRRSNGAGAFIGAIASALLVFAVQTYTSVHFFLYGAIGIVSAMIIGYLASLVLPAPPKNIEGLTVYTAG